MKTYATHSYSTCVYKPVGKSSAHTVPQANVNGEACAALKTEAAPVCTEVKPI